jgi:hypothetical protein
MRAVSLLRHVTLLVLLFTLTACSTSSRLFWADAFRGAADRVQNTRTVYCSTTYRHGVAYTSCY